MVATVEALPRRPEPPAALSRRSATLWREIVAGYAPNHFAAGDLPMLASYCAHAEQLAELDARLLRDGLLIKKDKTIIPHPAINVRATIVKALATFGAKLRLPVNARLRVDKAATAPAARRSGPPPWNR